MRHPLAICLGLVFTLQLSAQDYEIKLNRKPKIGERYRQTAIAEEGQSLSLTSEGKTLREDNNTRTIKYESIFKVEELDAKGESLRETHTVAKLERINKGKTESLISKDTVVTATSDGKKESFQIGGKPVDPEIAQALGMVIDLKSSEHTDDDMFGTKDRKKVGESWPINAPLLSKELAASAEEFKLTGLTGNLTLKSVNRQEGKETMNITGLITGKITPAMPPGFKIDSASMSVRLDGKFPVDVTLPPSDHSEEVSISFSGHGSPQPGGPEVQMKAAFTKKSTGTVTVLR